MKNVRKAASALAVLLLLLFSAIAEETVECAFPEDFANAFRDKPEEICVLMTESMFEYVTRNEWTPFFRLTGKAGIKAYDSVYYADTYEFVFENIEYYENFSACMTEEEVLCALIEADTQSASLYLDQSLYSAVTANETERLTALEGMAGIESCERQYIEASGLILYTDLAKAENFVYAESFDDIREFISEAGKNEKTSFVVSADKELYEFLWNNDRILYQLMANEGMFMYDSLYLNPKRTRYIKNIVYYPGAKIIKAVEKNDFSSLTDEENLLYEEALKIACPIKEKYAGEENGEIMMLKEIVKAVCERTSYTTEGGDEHNTAVGALLNGKCDCDGYADAMYLLGRLAGLEIGYQYGKTKDMGVHMWNIVRIEDEWYFTDATGCDIDSFPGILYVDWMLMDEACASSRYTWFREAAYEKISEDIDTELFSVIMDGYVFENGE